MVAFLKQKGRSPLQASSRASGLSCADTLALKEAKTWTSKALKGALKQLKSAQKRGAKTLWVATPRLCPRGSYGQSESAKSIGLSFSGSRARHGAGL